MQHQATDHLHIKVAHPQGPFTRLTHSGKGLYQQIIEPFTLLITLFELCSTPPQLHVAQRLHCWLKGIDLLDCTPQPFDQTFIAAAEDLTE